MCKTHRTNSSEQTGSKGLHDSDCLFMCIVNLSRPETIMERALVCLQGCFQKGSTELRRPALALSSELGLWIT